MSINIGSGAPRASVLRKRATTAALLAALAAPGALLVVPGGSALGTPRGNAVVAAAGAPPAASRAAPALPSPAPAGANPRRVASANLSADEILAAILPHERLVSVTRWVDDPASSPIAGRVPASIFRVRKADLESLVALDPDLVVVSEYTDADFLRLLERSGLRVHRLAGLSTLDGVRRAVLDLGRAVGEERAAGALVRRYDAVLAELRRRLAGAPRPRVLYWSGGMTAGANTAIGALIEAAGAANVGRELGVEGIAPPGAERAFVADPDVVLVSTWPGADTAVTQDPLLSKLRAVKQGRILAMDNALLVALSQYTADAVWRLANLLHPDRVPEPAPPKLLGGADAGTPQQEEQDAATAHRQRAPGGVGRQLS